MFARASVLRGVFAGFVTLSVLLAIGLPARPAAAKDVQRAAGGYGTSLPTVRTDSPRQTLASFVRLRDALETELGAYRENGSAANAGRIAVVAEQMRQLFDFSAIPAASRREVGFDTGAYVLDILGRVGVPDLDDVPDLDEVGAKSIQHYQIPRTPLRIVRIDQGPRTGEFLFGAGTVDTAPWFDKGIESLPLSSTLPIGSWVSELRELTGPMIPTALVAALPDRLRKTVLGTPAWKIGAVLSVLLVAGALLFLLHRFVTHRRPSGPRGRLWLRAMGPLAVIAAAVGVWYFSTAQINVGGPFAWWLGAAMAAIGFLALAWAGWAISLALFESVVRRSDFPEENLDADLLRLIARIVGVVIGTAVLVSGAQAMGLPVVSVLAGLGIGGLAVALAIRPTLENLIGGFILYLDKPIRVGDFCSFGTQSGTVESIGVRSTQIRALDRTLITVPNAQFADMQITNWAECDQMLIQQTIGLRHETAADQLRYVLAKIREMFHSHPRIDPDTVRVRFSGYGPSSLDLLIRVYARTREWNDFYAIQEDVLFRIKEIVEQAGTGFAFSSHTLYLGRDGGVDAEQVERVQKEVSAWRRTGRLPFPRFPAGTLERLAGSLHYPPRGSPDFNATEEEEQKAGEERLSAEPPPRVEAAQPEVAGAGEPERR